MQARPEFCSVFSLIVFQATSADNMWPRRSKSARSQVPAAVFHIRTVTFVKNNLRKIFSQFRSKFFKGRLPYGRAPGAFLAFRLLPGIGRDRYRWLYVVVGRTFTRGPARTVIH